MLASGVAVSLVVMSFSSSSGSRRRGYRTAMRPMALASKHVTDRGSPATSFPSRCAFPLRFNGRGGLIFRHAFAVGFLPAFRRTETHIGAPAVHLTVAHDA